MDKCNKLLHQMNSSSLNSVYQDRNQLILFPYYIQTKSDDLDLNLAIYQYNKLIRRSIYYIIIYIIVLVALKLVLDILV